MNKVAERIIKEYPFNIKRVKDFIHTKTNTSALNLYLNDFIYYYIQDETTKAPKKVLSLKRGNYNLTYEIKKCNMTYEINNKEIKSNSKFYKGLIEYMNDICDHVNIVPPKEKKIIKKESKKISILEV